MKRMHLHVSVDNLNKSIGFYSSLFGAKPAVEKADYAKWLLDDPLVNFAISKRGLAPGLDHIGIQVENEAELLEIQERLEAAELSMITQQGTTCCYSKSDKHWVQDPSGIAWETYHTLDSSPTFSNHESIEQTTSACCAPPTQSPIYDQKVIMNILFLCTGNSCRSILAEATFNALAPSGMRAMSAGSQPTGEVHPRSIALLKREGISTDGYYSKSWNDLPITPDIIISVCGNAAGETCPAYLGKAIRAHWGTADTAKATGSVKEINASFENAYRTLRRRIEKFFKLDADVLAVKNKLSQALN